MEFIKDGLSVDELVEKIRNTHYVDSGSISVPVKSTETKFQDFVEAQEKGYSVLLRFTIKNEKELRITFDDCVVVCPLSEFKGNLYLALERQFEALITDIDIERKIVMVSCVAAREKIETKRESDAKNLDKYIVQQLKKGERVVYPAKIVRTYKDGKGVVVSILGTGVIGHVFVKDWAPNYVVSLHEVVKVGEWYDVEILSKRKSKYQEYYWNCSRVNIADNPWNKKNIEDRFKKNDLLTVKCVTLDKKRDCWWGVSEEVREIQILCDFRAPLQIQPGRLYKCYVKVANSENKKFVAVPISEITDIENSSKNVVFRNPTKK